MLTTILDMAGVAVFAISGALAAARARQTIVTFALFAAVTGIGGGTLRDVLAGEPSIILRPEIYVSAAALGASAFVIASQLGAPTPLATAVGFAAGFGLRALAIARGISLPSYRTDTD